MKRVLLILMIGLIALVGIVTYTYANIYLPNYYSQQSIAYYNRQLSMMGYGPQGPQGMMGGMMGGYYMMGYHEGYAYGYYGSTPISEAVLFAKNVQPYAKVFPQNDTIVFSSTQINLVVLSMGHGRAFNLTNYTAPPSAHSQNNVFVIDGLINPTLIVPGGSVLNVELINLDAGDYHNLAVTPVPPPYPYYSMMHIRMDVVGMTPMVPYANYNDGQAYESSFSISLQPGIYYYVCEYPGHAEMGMYGEIVVT
ncbi:hypothetical protein L3N51_02325 [Metallosphaera sp. J1]|uniref:plastocyanin/azurin family copper-binding protein n=1 Tax=Metallosphaera TaxID=41980 RepID=UPI001EDFFCBA|nr:plastocyanin/azurin family copper-binding protein [Metallosphaera javensis (ex Hofmann et al. 2022)]MCG3110028.1 hypothetical protein [Metallosphaera javensis (ex Hofmann et al. 2022)]BCS93200.1 MAG: rusticyanin [Metallosphaera javensis (ex Sakai et al. 2022)]